MPDRKTVEAFASLVEQAEFVAALEAYYDENAWTQENQGEAKHGRAALIAGEKATLARFDKAESKRLSPIMIEGDHVAIRWRFVFTKDGKPTTIDEIALQTWKSDRIVEEHFFYDPAQIR